jgi:hypothetical protein
MPNRESLPALTSVGRKTNLIGKEASFNASTGLRNSETTTMIPVQLTPSLKNKLNDKRSDYLQI